VGDGVRNAQAYIEEGHTGNELAQSHSFPAIGIVFHTFTFLS
jgi:hypothetical protein